MFLKRKKYYFLSGLPRSGNTLLSCILNQNKKISATANSPVADILYELEKFKNEDPKFKNFPDTKSIENVNKKVFDNYYSNWNYQYIIDRSCWGTPENLSLLKKYCPNEIKIIILMRDLNEVLASFLHWSEKNPQNFLEQFETAEEKCELLMSQNGQIMKHLQSAYNLVDCNDDLRMFIKYEDLVNNCEKKISEIYEFLGIKKYKHNFDNITDFEVNKIKYDDLIFGKNLHAVKNKIEKSEYEYKSYVPNSIAQKYKNYNALYLSL